MSHWLLRSALYLVAVAGVAELCAAERVSISIAEQCNNYYAPSTFRRMVSLASSSKESMELELEVKIGEAFRATEGLRLGPRETRELPFDIEVPMIEQQSTAPIEYTVRRKAEIVASTSAPLWLAPMSIAFFELPPTTQTILLMGETSRTRAVLNDMACRHETIRSDTKPGDFRIAVLDGGGSTNALEHCLPTLRKHRFFDRGGTLLVLDAGDDSVALPVVGSGRSTAGPSVIKSKEMAKLFPDMPFLLDNWGKGLVEPKSVANNPDTFAWKAAAGSIPIVVHPLVKQPRKHGTLAPIVCVKETNGFVILNGLPLLEFCRLHPAAGLLLRKLIAQGG